MARRGRGEGTIYQRTDGRWAAQITIYYDPVTGRQKRKTLYGQTRGEVASKLKSTPAATGAGPDRTVGEAAREWLREKEATVAPTTVAYYRVSIGRIIEGLGGVPLSRLKHGNVSAFYANLAQSAGSTSVRKAAQFLRSVLKRAVRLGYCPASAAALVPLPRHEAGEISIWTVPQLQAILAQARGLPDGVLVWLAADTGARISELLALTDNDLDMGRGEIHIHRSLRRETGGLVPRQTKTKAGRRRVPLGASALKVLKEHLASPRRQARLKKDGPAARARAVFLTNTGSWCKRQRIAELTYNKAVTGAGLPHRKFHSLRHTCASLLLAANVHPMVVKQRLGHERIEMTLGIYSHLLPTSQESAVRALSEAVAVPQQSAAPVAADVSTEQA